MEGLRNYLYRYPEQLIDDCYSVRKVKMDGWRGSGGQWRVSLLRLLTSTIYYLCQYIRHLYFLYDYLLLSLHTFLPSYKFTSAPLYINFNSTLQTYSRLRGEDTTGDALLRSEWNKHVMRDVISPLYVLLLVKACEHLQAQTASALATSVHMVITLFVYIYLY